ncbi:type VI secretion system-associated protein TagF [Tropicimonas sp.]|uniref:type VI secretion system-associated protein TagF n=1 Tax=Tropicimonas sp. TaxID=2067044 RepID=UPI003A85DCD1
MPADVLMPVPVIHGAIGAFGKMPSQGDFFRFETPKGFVRAWDGWLQRTFPGARQTLGARWEECYYSAPIWRFSILPGVVTTNALAGVIMPSVDRVGRAFPLTLVCAVAPESATADAHLAQAPFFFALEEIALDALDDATTRESLAMSLRAFRDRCRSGMLAPVDRARCGVIVTRGVQSRCQWSSQLENGVVQLRTSGLPDLALLARMFDSASTFWITEAAG